MQIFPSLWLMVLVFVTFIFLIIALNRILYKPLLNFMDSRDASIKHDMESVESNANEIRAMQEEARKILVVAKKEAEQIKEKARNAAKEVARGKLEAKHSELGIKYEEFMKQLQEDRVGLKNSLRAQIPLFRESLKAKFAKMA